MMVTNGIDTMRFSCSALNVKVVSSSPCLLRSPVLSCAVLSCAVPRRAVAVAVPVPATVRLHIWCITVTFRLSVRVSFPVCCGRYVCFSKPLTFPQWFHFFCFSCMFRALFKTSSISYFTHQVGLAVSKSA